MKPCSFFHFSIIISPIFPEDFFEIRQVVLKLSKIFLSILTIFVGFIDSLDF